MERTFECNGGTYSIDQCINGQAPLTFYDSLAQIALRPSLREGTIMCYWKQGLEGLFAQLQSAIGADSRVVKTNPYYWTEYCSEETLVIKVAKNGAASSAGGTSVHTIAMSNHSHNGKFSKPRAGYRAYIKELKNQGVNITAVDKSVNGAHTITFEALNGEVIDMTKLSTYTILVDTMRLYTKGDTQCITKHGLVSNPPILRQGFVQKYEDGICVHEDEIDGYAYDQEFHVVKGISSVTGKPIDQWCIPQINEKLQEKIMDSRNINFMINVRDDVKQQGYDGLMTTAESQGAFNVSYDPASGVSFLQMLFNQMRLLRKTNGCNDNLLLHDWGFGLDWAEAFPALIKANNQSYNYKLFGDGGEGARNFKYYDFGDFEAFGYHWRKFQVDGFDAQRYGALFSDFALTMPACKFTDTNGKTVPPVTMTTIEGCEPAKTKNMWVDDTRTRGCRTVDFYVKDAHGLEIHCASKLGVMRKKKC
jgi:hypothetical protein